MATCPGNLSRIDFDPNQGNLSSGTTLLNVESKSRIPAAIPEVSNLSNSATDALFAAKVDTDEILLGSNSSSKMFSSEPSDILEEEAAVVEVVELPEKTPDFSEFLPETPQIWGSKRVDSDEQKSSAVELVLSQLPLGEERTVPEEEASIIDEVGGEVGISSSSIQFDSSCSTVGSPCHGCLQPFEEEKELKTDKDAVCRPNSEKAEVRFSTVRVVSTCEISLLIINRPLFNGFFVTSLYVSFLYFLFKYYTILCFLGICLPCCKRGEFGAFEMKGILLYESRTFVI